MVKFQGAISSPEELGDAIRQGREILGWSQRRLAAELGVTQKWLWELEQGKPGCSRSGCSPRSAPWT